MENLLDDTHPQQVIAPKLYRVCAAIIDLVLLLAFGYVISAASGQSKNFNGENGDGFKIGFALTGVPALLLIVVWFLMFPVMESRNGQTIGKKVFKLQVLNQDFSPATIKTTLIRHLLDLIDVIFFAGLIVASGNSRNQRIGDLVAKSIVVIKS